MGDAIRSLTNKRRAYFYRKLMRCLWVVALEAIKAKRLHYPRAFIAVRTASATQRLIVRLSLSASSLSLARSASLRSYSTTRRLSAGRRPVFCFATIASKRNTHRDGRNRNARRFRKQHPVPVRVAVQTPCPERHRYCVASPAASRQGEKKWGTTPHSRMIPLFSSHRLATRRGCLRWWVPS